MRTATDIIRECVERADLRLRPVFSVSKPFIHFESGYTPTVVNSLTELSQGFGYEPYPLVAVFTEGLTEKRLSGLMEFHVPKMIIAVRAVENLTEAQRIEVSFRKVLHPIFTELEHQLQAEDFSYGLSLERSDVPYYTESGGQASTFNDMLDGIIIRNLRMKVLEFEECRPAEQ